MKEIWDKIPSWLKNKYVIALSVFLMFMIFLDNNNVFYQYRLSKEQKKLEGISTDLRVKIAALKKINMDLEKNPLAIEKIAREKYGMKRADETVFILP
jgi:cell division protein DivIC